jgi:hypothetical protein
MSTRTARATRLGRRGRGPIDLAIDIRVVALVVAPRPVRVRTVAQQRRGVRG